MKHVLDQPGSSARDTPLPLNAGRECLVNASDDGDFKKMIATIREWNGKVTHRLGGISNEPVS